MGIRDFVKAISPGFLIGPGTPGATLPALAGVAERYLYSLSLGSDVTLEKVTEAVTMRFPGKGDASALPYTGADRLIARGPYETDASYSERLAQWLDLWSHAGQARGVITAIAGYFSPVEMTIESILEGAGQTIDEILNDGDPWYTLPTTNHISPATFNWDGMSWPKRRFLVIAHAGVSSGITWAPMAAVWGAGTWGQLTHTWGFDFGPGIASDLRTIVAQWKGGGTRYPWIVVTNGPWLAPSGDYGCWSKIDSSGVRPVRVPARPSSARYISGVNA